MTTAYQKVYEVFLHKIGSDEDLAKMTQEDAEYTMQLLLESACAEFLNYCHQNLDDKDDTLKQFNITLTRKEIEILALWMIYYRSKTKLQKEQGLLNMIGSKDYQIYSPANLVKQLSESADNRFSDANTMMLEYYVNQGDFRT